MDIIVAARELLHKTEPLPQYAGMLMAYIVVGRLIPQAKKMTLFVWIYSFPITVYLFVLYVKDMNLIPFHIYSALFFGIFFAQFGWLGALLSVASYFTRFQKMSFAAFGVSALTMSLHVGVICLLIISPLS